MEATLEGAESASAYEWSDGKTITGTTAATNSLTNLTADTEYTYKVRARIDNDNVAGYTPWVGISFRTLAE